MDGSIFCTVLVVLSLSKCCESESKTLCKVSINSGQIIGAAELSRCGRPYCSYRGIPYAKPPVGELRFKAPVLPEKWTTPLNATKEGPFCIQKNYFFSDPVVEGEEDCLYLNVYSPKRNCKKLLPVMVFIHWGGFFAGRGTSDYLHPEYFMDKDVILVTLNYRLGLFGFLTTLDDVASGNYGLKDQVLSLKWVQENIIKFGGNRNKVTIFGQSAGAGSVHYHLLSPSSKGLFQRAISQSGSALAVWTRLGNSDQASVLAAQASFVDCGDYVGNSSDVISCLRNVSATTLAESQDLFKVFSINPLTVYATVAENETYANPEPFLTKTPLEYIQNGEFQNISWIIGTVEDEGMLMTEGLLRQTTTREDLNAQFDTVFPNVLMGLSISTNDSETLYENIKQQYLLGNNYVNISNPESISGFNEVYTDRVFAYSAYQSAMLHSAMGHKPIWFYKFNYKGQYTYGDLFAATNETIDYDWGVSHCDDLLYLFKSPALFSELQNNDVNASKLMVNMWTNFAINGNPSPTLNKYSNINWSPLDINGYVNMKNKNLCLLNIEGSYVKGISLNTSCGYFKERMEFWATQQLYENFDGLN